MRLNYGRSNVVLAGAWNVAIFTREWLTENVGATPDAPELAIVNGRVVFQFTLENVRLETSDGQVIVTPMGGDQPLTIAQGVAQRILDLLPQTPVTAFGINVCFDATETSDALDAILAMPDLDLVGTGFATQGVVFTRRLRADGLLVNMTVNRPAGGQMTQLNFNHHWDLNPPTAATAREKLSALGLATRSLAVDLAQKIYGLVEET